MAYARFGWDNSDVYVYLDTNGYLCCCACSFMPTREGGLLPSSFKAYSTVEMLCHLDQHRLAGHTVPVDTTAELQHDAAENDAWLKEQAAV